ncbi:MAG: hypothetical protein K1X89_22840 [Myxococcaceae bacterium]|nr:hypothetical protein [Myxococcaceae bacterium]
MRFNSTDNESPLLHLARLMERSRLEELRLRMVAPRKEVTKQAGAETQTFSVDPVTGSLELKQSHDRVHQGSNPIAALLRAFGKEDGFDEPRRSLVALS